jgi:TatD DNase family protein
MIDTHAHLDFENFDEDREEVISRFFSQNGKAIVNVGVDLERSRKSIEIAEKHGSIFVSVGLHPDYFTQHETRNTKQDWIGDLRELAKNEKVVAIGETGLDYFRIGDNGEIGEIRERQRKGFVEQIKLAQELNLPVIVHCREAWDDLYDIVAQNSKRKAQNHNAKLKNKNDKFILHCYSGDRKDTEKFLELPNVNFSFSGNITYPKPIERAEKLAEAVRMIPLDRIMLDSDSPYLAPQEFRGKRNEPTYVKYIAQKIADIKEISGEKVEKVTDQNAEKFFGIG